MGMETSDQVKACLEKAAECERRALVAADENYRETYLELAQQWREIAGHAERLNRRHSQSA
jgi:hypothetical protein